MYNCIIYFWVQLECQCDILSVALNISAVNRIPTLANLALLNNVSVYMTDALPANLSQYLTSS